MRAVGAFRRSLSVGQGYGPVLLQYLIEYLAGLTFFHGSVCSAYQLPGVYSSQHQTVPRLLIAAASPACGSRSGLLELRLHHEDGCRPCCRALTRSVASSAIMAVRAAAIWWKFCGVHSSGSSGICC